MRVQYRPLSRRLDRCDRVIQNESRDPFGGNVYYVTMQITFLTRKFRNVERNLHCDVVHITTKWVSSLTLDCNGVFAIKASNLTDRAGTRDRTNPFTALLPTCGGADGAMNWRPLIVARNTPSSISAPLYRKLKKYSKNGMSRDENVAIGIG